MALTKDEIIRKIDESDEVELEFEDEKLKHKRWSIRHIYTHFGAFGLCFVSFVVLQAWQSDFETSQILNAVYALTKPLYNASKGFLAYGLTFYMLHTYFPSVLLAINENVNTLTLTDILINKSTADGKLLLIAVIFLGQLIFWGLMLGQTN